MTSPEPTAWAHLPNARHIDGILADAQARPEAWELVVVAWAGYSWSAANDVIHTGLVKDEGVEVYDAMWDAARDAASGPELAAAWDMLTNVLTALLAWPDSARMLTMTPAALRTLIDITEGDVRHQAVLILPAVLAGYVPTEGDYQWT